MHSVASIIGEAIGIPLRRGRKDVLYASPRLAPPIATRGSDVTMIMAVRDLERECFCRSYLYHQRGEREVDSKLL